MQKIKMTLPTGREFTFSEANAEQEGILTKEGNKAENEHFPKYLSAISGLPLDEIMKWPLNDKYYAIIASRVLNHGPELKFDFEFKEKQPITFIEDLTAYLEPDLVTQLGYAITEQTGTKVPKPYSFGKDSIREITLSSGKKIKYQFINSYGEKLIAKKSKENLDSNDIFKARFLEWDPQQKGDWIVVQNFREFSVRDTRELRADIIKYDTSWDLYLDIQEPGTNHKEEIPLVLVPGFLTPSEV
jgi:hypothetical protein